MFEEPLEHTIAMKNVPAIFGPPYLIPFFEFVETNGTLCAAIFFFSIAIAFPPFKLVLQLKFL